MNLLENVEMNLILFGIPLESNLPYVEMGFDALDCDLIQKLENHNQHVLSNYGSIDLQARPLELIKVSNIF